MLANLQATFAMLSFCSTQQPTYLQCIVFPSQGSLQHYTEFDVHAIVMLEKILGSKSFGTTMGHLACCQIILHNTLRGLGLPLMV